MEPETQDVPFQEMVFLGVLRAKLDDEVTLAVLVDAFRGAVGPEAEPAISNPYLIREALLQALQ